MAQVKITNTYVVKPAEPTPIEVVPLSEFDHLAGPTWVPVLYFYKSPDQSTLLKKPISDTLRESLSIALVHYYPLAGRLIRLKSGWMKLRNSGEGAVMMEAEMGEEMPEMGDMASNTAQFKHLLPAVDFDAADEELALLHVQITRFGCGGFSVGLVMSHAVADGCSAFYFISDWARLARGEAIETYPSHDRTVLRAGAPPIGSIELELPARQPQTESPKETAWVVLPLAKGHVEKLKKAANSDIGTGRRPYSRYEVLAGHIWRCTCKVRGHESEETRGLGIAVDARYRLPSFPKKYFGNTAFIIAARAKAGDLVSQPLSYSCGRIRKTIESVNEEYIWSEIDFFKRFTDDFSICMEMRALRSPEGPYVSPNPGVISWLSMPLHGVDFGWGKEVHMSSCVHSVDGLVFVYPSKVEGDVVISMTLQTDHIEGFKKHFYDDII